MSNIYDIQEKIKESLNITRNPALYFENNILKECPDETVCLFPGKLYVFDYHMKDTKKLYDTHPYVMSLGPDKEIRTTFYAINMHHMPYSIRLQFFTYVYKQMSSMIDKEIENNVGIEDAKNQNFILAINSENMLKIPFVLKPAINKYKIENISDCKLVNYNLIHYMLQSDENFFKNGTIQDAQAKYMEAVLKPKNNKAK